MFRTILTRQNKAFLHTTRFQSQNYFDTFKFVERLEQTGFTRDQSEVIMTCLQKVINER